jgi:hypothetical protein
LLVSRASCQKGRQCSRCQQGISYGFQLQSPVRMIFLSNDSLLTVGN